MASNDFVISTNLVVFGMSTFTGGLTFDGAMILDVDSTEALLVRKDSDGGDVFTVNTSGDLVTLGASTDLLWASEDGDIGASSATRPANVHVKSTVVIGDDETAGYGITIGDNHQGHAPLWIVGSFASDGAQSFSAVSAWNMSLTGFAGDTVLAGLHVVNSITTQGATEVLTNVASLFIDEPNITVGTGDTITNADTLLITGEPTEGVTNAALRVAAGHVILPSENDANTPTLSFGDGDSGFYEQGDDSIQLALAGGSSVRWNTTSMRSLVNGSWNLSHAVASGTVPPYNFQGDTNTGMGKNAADQLSLIAGGVEVLRLSNATEFAQSRWSGAFTSDGSSNLATGALFGSDVTSADGDTALSQVRMGGTNVGGSLTTPGTGQSLFAATLWLDEPDITLSGGDSMTTSATLYISGAPTEGTSNNFALFVDNGAARFDGVLDMKENSTFSNPAKTFTFGSGVPQTYAHVAIIGAFTSSGLSNQAAHLYIAGALTGANGDTVSLAALKLQNSITTQGTSNTITDVAQIVCHEPVITVGAGDTITNASTLVLFGSPTEGTNNFSIRSTGAGAALFAGRQLSIGQSTLDGFAQFIIRGAFTSDGSSFIAGKVDVTGGLIGASGDSELATAFFRNNITTQTAAETVTDVSQVVINDPVITLGAGSSVTNAQSLKINGSPTEGTNNFAIRSTGPAPSLFIGQQFVVGQSAVDVNWQFLLAGSFTTGAAGETAKLRIEGALIGASGTTTGIFGSYFDASITTQTETESIADIAQVRIDEPNITDNLTGDITHASTLLLTNSPTEGEDNWAIRSLGGAPSLFAGAQFVINRSTVDDWLQVIIGGAFTSGGSNTLAAKVRTEGSVVGAAGDTTLLAGMWLDVSVATQTATESIGEIAQLRIDEPAIIDNLTGGGLITTAQTLFLSGSPTEGVANYSLRSAGAAPSLFAGLQFVIGDFAVDDYHQVLISGSFTSGGTSDRAAKFRLEGNLTGASGDTGTIQGAFFDASIITQTATENIADISQVRIDEPNITDNLTGDITVAHTLFLVGSPTEGESNFSLRSTGSAPTMLQGAQFHVGSGTVPIANYRQILFTGSFTSGGASDRATKFRVEGILTGASGDTNLLAGSHFDAAIVTQTETESIGEISQVRIDDPTITDNLTGDITTAQTLLLSGSPTEGETNFAIRSTGPAASMFFGNQFFIGTNVLSDVWQVQIRGNYTSGGSSNRAAKFEVEEALIGVSGDTVFLGGASFDAAITTQTAAEVIADVFQVRIDEPAITLGAGSSITNASTLLIAGAPTEGVTNDALRIVSGSSQFPQGSAAAPSIRFGNVGTGIYQATTNDVLVTIDGVSLIKVTDSGAINRLSFHSDLSLTWTSGSAESGGPQFGLLRESTAESQSSVGDLALASIADFSVYQQRTSSSSYHRTSIRHREETLSNVSGASVTTTITAIPDGALVLGVTTTVEVALGTSNGTTGYQVGDGTDADRWGDITGTSTSTESDDADFTVATVDRFTSSGEVTITAVGGNFDGTGDILVVVHFLEIGANRP